MRTRMKKARNAAGMTQGEAASSLGVSIGTYRNWEQGRVVMNGEQLISAANLFRTNVDFLLMTESSNVEKPEDELSALYDSMSDEGKDVLLIVARSLAEQFQR